eukprot:gnl/TRDRNA2_/TRDRNA2_118333_c1_seq2.p1 gnl/TRDRNA2_/TRDRNA2_118333_c1~~gnl/TRDRNA2_/TRDRNA2_118333_c1_seq2.p1  ORF type:complete len:126 (+),score=17.94 gnl/TRDRNA2_/TRDRNA2_118333_c1_seq2:426-803(+)
MAVAAEGSADEPVNECGSVKCRRIATSSESTPEVGNRSAALLPTYAWLKMVAAGPAYLERRRRFHDQEPFSHWRPKPSLAFRAADGYEPAEAGHADSEEAQVDCFTVDLPPAMIPTSMLPRNGTS